MESRMDHSDKLDINLYSDNDTQAPGSLDRLRQSLSDNSAGNRLIHCPLEHGEVVRLVDELPDQVYDMLNNGHVFDLAPLPAPSHQELIDEGHLVFDRDTGEYARHGYPEPEAWARRHHINPDYELSSGKSGVIDLGHADDSLQTLLFPVELESRLSGLHQLAQDAQHESGGHALYLSLGFLEWYESTSSRTPHLSPLFIVPVDLNRGNGPSMNGTSNYQISLRDEGIYNNTCLSGRLLQDFDVTLPTLEDDCLPEDYFNSLAQHIDGVNTRWSVRRFAALCQLDFSRQLMYEDLAPYRWPDESGLTENPILQQCLLGDENAATSASSLALPTHPIDEMSNIHRDYPLIHDADSSQHSVLIDIINGHSRVIAGPPGSGKSQTIANVIAASLNKGLDVLFMSNKQAALDVVRQRLDQAELGDFCLELNSHATSRSAFLDSLNRSVKRREHSDPPAGLQEQINRYEEHGRLLAEYTRKLNEPWRNTELTPHQILQRATDFTDRAPSLQGSPLIPLDDPGIITATFIRQTLESAERLQVVLALVEQQTAESAISSHPWFGLSNADILAPERQALMAALERWTQKQQRVMSLWDELQDTLQVEQSEAPAQEVLSMQLRSLEELPLDISENQLQGLDELRGHTDSLIKLQRDRTRFRQDFTQLSASFRQADLFSEDRANSTIQCLLSIRDELGLTDTATMTTIASHVELIAQLRQELAAFFDKARDLQNSLPADFNDAFEPTLDGLQLLGTLGDVCAGLSPRLWRYRDDRYRDSDFAEALDEMEPRILALREQYGQLHPAFNLEKLPASEQLRELGDTLSNAGFYAFFRPKYHQARKRLRELSRTGIRPDETARLLPQLVVYQQGMEELHDTQKHHPALGGVYRSLDTNLALHRTLVQWYRSVAEQFDSPRQQDKSLANGLFALDNDAAGLLQESLRDGLRDTARRLQENVEKVQSTYPNHFSALSSDSHLLDSAVGLTGLCYRLEAHLTKLRQCVEDPSLSLAELIDRANLWSSSAREHREWVGTEFCKRWVPSLFAISANPETDDSSACSELEQAIALLQLAPSGSLFSRAMQQEPSLAQLDRLRQAMPALNSELDEASSAQTEFETIGQVNRTQWQSNVAPLSQCHRHNTRALQQSDCLDAWLSYQRARQRTASDTLGALLDRLEDGSIPTEQAQTAIQADLYRQLAIYMLQQDDELSSLDGNEIQAVRQQFQRYDKELQALQRMQIAANCSRRDVPLGDCRGTADTLSELLLIQHETDKRQPQASLRSIFKRAPGAIQALKPCIMMSPMSVARYLEPGQYDFDLIIIDESSQIPLEEALGGIARARQVMVVGDDRQLLPSSWLQRTVSEQGVGESEVANEANARSILDAVAPVLPMRRLRWHYRSHHESLINLAAREFNDIDLAVFPSPFVRAVEYGVNLTRLDDGIFIDDVNRAEADHVINLLAAQIQQRPHESVGVVAITPQQCDQIEACWEKRLSSDSVLRQVCERKRVSSEPLYFKALQHIHGHERDVIMFSLTVGPRLIGSTAIHGFGCIGSADGWRHLRALLTHARKRMEIIASIGSCDIRADNPMQQCGLMGLRALLSYCESAGLHSTCLPETTLDSAFEASLIRRLTEAGFRAVPRWGVAGIFIDVAVRNPDRPDEFLMGIDCDGSDDHEAESVRDRERLRYETLGRLGWNMRRICSTDWFRNADAQAGAIVAELEQLRIAANRSSVTSRGNQKNAPGTSISAHAVRNSRFIDV